jgi:RNA polymerase sigma factor (sigma-70 family)
VFGAAKLTDELVVAAAEGSRDGLARLLEHIAPQARLMVAARLSATPAEFHAVEEICQLAMVALSDSVFRLQNRTVVGLRSFLSGIVSRKVADHLKRRGEGDLVGPTHASLDSATSYDAVWQFLSAGGMSPGSELAHAEQLAQVMSEIGHLKNEHREIITLAFFDQMPTGEIARNLGISRRAASMRLIRAVKAIRRNLTGSSRIENHHDK